MTDTGSVEKRAVTRSTTEDVGNEVFRLPGDRQPPSVRDKVVPLLEAWGLLILLVLFAMFFSLWSETRDTFPTLANLEILVSNQSVPAIVALGALVPLVLYQFDLSVGAVAGLSAVFTAAWLSGGMNVLLALMLGLGLGLAVGLVNALLVARMGFNEVIATLGVATILEGVVSQKTGGLALVSNIPRSLTNFGTGKVLGVPNSAIVLAAVALLLYYVLEQTAFGRQLHAYGSNASAAALVGINTRRALAISFITASLLSGLAGLLYLARAGGASPAVGPGFTLPALAAAFLSAAAVKPGHYNVRGTLIAIFFLAVVNNGLNLAGVHPYVGKYVNGLALVAGVGLAAILYRRRT
jgi:ribose transport system permease protein